MGDVIEMFPKDIPPKTKYEPEWNLLSESLVLYACRNPRTGKYKTRYGEEDSFSLSPAVQLYKRKGNAEENGKRYGFTEVIKVKLVEIE